MSHSQSEPHTEEYSPEALEIMAKARRRAMISMLIMLLGFMAVAGVIVYRLVTMDGAERAPDPRYSVESVSVPAGASVIAGQVNDGLVTVTYSLADETFIRIVDGESGELVGEIAVVSD